MGIYFQAGVLEEAAKKLVKSDPDIASLLWTRTGSLRGIFSIPSSEICAGRRTSSRAGS